MMRQNSQLSAQFESKYAEHNLSNAMCLVGISVGHEQHTGNKLAALISLLNQKKFAKVYFLVADSLQAYNLLIAGITTSEEAARQQAASEGDKWLEKQDDTLKTLTVPYEILRWEGFRQDRRFQDKLKLLEQKLISDTAEDVLLKTKVDQAAGQYLSTRLKKEDHKKLTFNLDTFIKYSRSYILEEMAVILLWDKQQFNFIVYPKSIPEPVKHIIKEYFPSPQDSSLPILQELVVNFSKPTPSRKIKSAHLLSTNRHSSFAASSSHKTSSHESTQARISSLIIQASAFSHRLNGRLNKILTTLAELSIGNQGPGQISKSLDEIETLLKEFEYSIEVSFEKEGRLTTLDAHATTTTSCNISS
jgi:tRNA-dependent cyclodipeptide synthase